MTAKAWNQSTLIRYERSGDLLRLTFTGVTNHERREFMIGLWCRLDADDRADHLAELHHYAGDPAAWLSPIASAVKEGSKHNSAIDLEALADRGERIKP